MQDKPWYQSKTIWGFGIAGLIAIAKLFNVPILDSQVGTLVEILTGLLGAYGVRDAIGKNAPSSKSR